MIANADEVRPSLTTPGVLLATWFGVGYLPKVPGTWGSAVAVPMAWVILTLAGLPALLVATAVVFGVGIWAANDYMDRSGVGDPGPVVIDEVAGQWLVLTVVPLDWVWFVIGFALFRLFDIAKPWPINVMDHRIKGGLGVMIDDIGAAIYAAAAAYGLHRAMEAFW